MSIIPAADSFDDDLLLGDPSIHSFIDRVFSTPFPFSSPLSSLPHSDLEFQTESGAVSTRFQSRELPEAYLFVAELPPGTTKDQVKVEIEEDGRVIKIRGERGGGGGGGPGGRFVWKVSVPRGVGVGEGVSESVEDGVVTVVVPKFGFGGDWGSERGRRRGNVRSIEIFGSG